MNPSKIPGNRLDIPAIVKSEHFFYKTQPLKSKASDVAIVAAAVEDLVCQQGLYSGEITSFPLFQLHNYGKKVANAINRLVSAMPEMAKNPSIVACEWASLHCDSDYSGTAFYSTVLHTGSEDYVMQVFHSEPGEHRSTALKTDSRLLSVGTSFVFDPTTPHCAVPRSLSGNHLLILLQGELVDESDDDRQEILKSFPPLELDLNQEQEIFSALGF